MTWATDRRLDYIDLLLLTQGRVRRDEIMAAFGITMSAASGDIAEFIAAHPDAMRYDKSAKQYVPANGRYRPVREGMRDAKRRDALMLLTRTT
jgi:hypothetical protein